ncbi:related to PHO84-high-affinity inorganic phosphate transporter [Ustilago bromivora]|uniref:Related to PHO84 - high-affinity inorganic phosphate transporter n=1 Tax=Ustilago bromivora TaxID=307758 RepID=A0A1K0HBD2_9BASI|nr:related to PHO84-high-affinity inorganic phosphate transporter [Ustilago bromivora]SYW76138.1 related to PHO84 - high-affinity inorganic phosphate transporter [Ustilago bromivora]
MPSATTSNSHTTYPSGSSSIPSSTSPPTAVTQRAQLRSSPDPPFYQSHGSTPRTCVSQSRAASKGNGQARAFYARNSYASQQEQGWEQDATCTDDFFDEEDKDEEDEEDYYQGQRKDSDHRPLLQRSSNSASCTSRSKKGGHPRTKRSNSIKMKRSNSHRLADQYKDDETAAKLAGQEVSSHTPRNSSQRGSSPEGQGSRGPKHVSFDDIFDATKTLEENKSMMISAELDRMGMGKYQMCIWFLCGCGYFIDLLWAQALGLIVTQVAYEFDDQIQGRTGPLQTAFSAGLTVGALFFGFAVDVVGRRWSFYLTTLIASVFGIASGGAGSFETLCVLAALIGFGIGGNIPIDATITIEFLPCNRRFLVAALSIFQPLGVLVCSGISYGLIPKYACDSAASCTRSNNMGWRYTLYTLGCITWLVFVARFFMFTFRESPQYLLARGKDAKALKIIQQILITNKSKIEPLFTQADFREAAKRIAAHEGGEYMDEEREGLHAGGGKASGLQQAKKSTKEMVALFLNAKTLFRDRTMARVTMIIWITFIGDFWGFTLAGFYLPQMLRAKGAAEDTSIEKTYRNYILIYLPGILAVALGAAMIEVPKLGRQWAMVVSSALMAVSFFLFTMVETEAASIGANAAEYFAQSFFNCILYAFVPEIYPSQVRGTASGLASTLGRLASIVAPLAADALYRDQTEQQAKQVLYLAASVTLLCPVALAFLPYDTRGIRVY